MTRSVPPLPRRAILATGAATALCAGRAAAMPADLAAVTAANRAIVRNFVELFYDRHDVRTAFERYVVPDYIQHNPGLADGRQAAVDALAPMFARAGAQFQVRHLMVDGELALVHLFGRGDPTTTGAAVTDIYRLADGKVVEHWDVIQPIAPGTDPLAMAPVAPGGKADRAAFQRFIELAYGERRIAQAYADYVAPDLIQHDAALGQGAAGALKVLAPMFAAPAARFTVHQVLVDGDLSAVHYHGETTAPGRGAAVCEIFRWADGRMVEHWDVYQPMPASSVNPHPMF